MVKTTYAIFGVVIVCLLCPTYPCSAQQDKQSQNPQFEKPDVSAKYPGGMQEFYKKLSQTIEYPLDAVAKKITGRVFVQFVVAETGEIDPKSVSVVKGIDPKCDAEAVRAIMLI